MQLVALALAAVAGLAAGESLKKLDTSLTILTNNDLQGVCVCVCVCVDRDLKIWMYMQY
jgi:hypothetical protein